jgi:pilus assembly protein Flp/PilA
MSVQLQDAVISMATRVSGVVRRLVADETAGTAIEYSLLASLIAVGCIGGMKALGTSMGGSWNAISNQIGSAMK